MDQILQTIKDLLGSFGGPIGAIIILILGIFIAKILRGVVKKLISKTGVDEKIKSDKVNLASLISKLFYYLVMIFVFMLALEKLGLTSVLEPVKELLNGFTNFIPRLVGAGLVGYIGYMLANIVAELVELSGDTITKFTPKLNLSGDLDLVNILKKVVFIFIFIPLLIVALNILNFDPISVPMSEMLQSFFEAIPKVLVASLIMIVTVIGGRFLSGLVKELLGSLNLNEVLTKAGLSSLTGKTSIENLISNIVFAFIVLFGLMTAIDKLEFAKLSEIMHTVIALAGNVLFGLVILAIGNWIANLASSSFLKTGDNVFVANIIKIAVLAIFLAIGLRRMGIADDIINLAFGITLGAIALTVVLSFGLGGREAAGKQMAKILDKFNKN